MSSGTLDGSEQDVPRRYRGCMSFRRGYRAKTACRMVAAGEGELPQRMTSPWGAPLRPCRSSQTEQDNID